MKNGLIVKLFIKFAKKKEFFILEVENIIHCGEVAIIYAEVEMIHQLTEIFP